MEELVEEVGEIKEEARPWVSKVARFGYVADGAVYLLVGLLALDASLGSRGADVDREQAMRAVVTEPLGRLLLVFIALGLVGYALGHFLMAARSPSKEKKTGLHNIVNRVAHVVNATVHISLALVAAQLGLRLGPTTSDGRTPQDWTRQLLEVPAGQALVIAIGLGFVGLAFYEFYKAYSANFREVLKLEQMSATQERVMIWIGRAGYIVRGVIYGLMGVFLIEASWTFNPEEARGLGRTLATIASQDYGLYLLAATALGLILFGVYVILLGRYRDFNF